MRITKVYTRTGDGGSTRLGDGQEVLKSHQRVASYGEMDELSSVIGIARSLEPPAEMDELLSRIQNELLNVGGELSVPGLEAELVNDEAVKQLEASIDHFNSQLPPLKEFILPGGNQLAAALHLARTVCRRAERTLINLHAQEPQRGVILKYINRLSDLLFVLARWENHRGEVTEVYWDKP